MNPTLTVMVGLPGSGKSTYIQKLTLNGHPFIHSTDFYVEECAKRQNKTYDEIYDEVIKEATHIMNQRTEIAIKHQQDVIWDQTNMASKKRKGILSRFPKSYFTKCICIQPPSNAEEWDELNSRLGRRPGKTIPDFVIQSMHNSYVEPSFSEGFDEIEIYDIFGGRLK